MNLPGWVYLYLFFCLVACQGKTSVSLEAGVGQSLAEYRKKSIKALEYQLAFEIPQSKSLKLQGQVKVLFQLDEPNKVVLDFRGEKDAVKTVTVNGKNIEAIVAQEHILIPEKVIKAGKNSIVIDFVAGDQSLNRSEDYLYTLLVPDRARTLFPCFDQPNLKAVFSLMLDIPQDWTAVANTPVVAEQEAGGRRKITFKPTRPLSTYLFSFVAGRWEKVGETRLGRTLTLYHRETDPEKVAQSKVIFDQLFAALQWMEEYTGIPYPFEKYDLIIVPGFQFGGMEHPGAVLYNDKRMFLSKFPTIEEELGRMELISHETAHMWFGDLVTMDWFNDVWTKEVFANYYASQMTAPQFPQVNHRLNALRNFYPSAYSEDRTLGANAIRQPLNNLNQAGLIYGQIVYNKAPIVLTKLVKQMGETAFRKGVQEYLHTYTYSNATWEELIRILDCYTPEDLSSYSRIWVDEKGMPEISAQVEEGKLVVRQKDRYGRKLVWPQEIEYALVKRAVERSCPYTVETLRVALKDTMVVTDINTLPEFIIPNMDGEGYGYFLLDSVSAAFCMENLSVFSDPVQRLSLMITLNENRIRGSIKAEEFARALEEHLKTETEPLLYTAAIGYLKDVCREKQGAENTGTENCLLNLVRARSFPGGQKAAFRALLEIWTSPEITHEVFRWWERKETVPGLQFSEREEMKMAYELAVRLPERYGEISAQQLQRISNPDRIREFSFVIQAVHPDQKVRDSLFQSLLVAENRRMEPWVQQVMYYLNHPLRAQQAVKYILPALEHLQDIQRTGDIFFPKNWVSACLSGHRNVGAAEVVRGFLEDNPDYPALLKNKILQSADHLYRK